jgi:hypothetical protein
MANNISVKDASAATAVVKTTDNGGIHTPHHNVDSLPANPFGANADSAVTTDAVGSISGKLRGLVKWAFERMPAALGQDDMAGSLPVAIASDQSAIPVTPAAGELFLGKLGSVRTCLSATPVLQTAGPYTTGYCLGSKLTLSNAARVSAGSGTIQSIALSDKGKQSIAADLILFDADPSSSTFTDNAAATIADADLSKIIGVVTLVAGDYAAFFDSSVATKRALDIGFKLASGSSLYAVLVTRGTPTYVSVSDLALRIAIQQD